MGRALSLFLVGTLTVAGCGGGDDVLSRVSGSTDDQATADAGLEDSGELPRAVIGPVDLAIYDPGNLIGDLESCVVDQLRSFEGLEDAPPADTGYGLIVFEAARRCGVVAWFYLDSMTRRVILVSPPVGWTPPPGGDASTGDASTGWAEVARWLVPAAVEASSELSAAYGAVNVIDGDSETSWNDAGLKGEGATLTFRFAEPVRVSYIVVENVANDVEFLRNFRINDYAIVTGEAADLTGSLEDTNEPQMIEIDGPATNLVELRVISTYPGESVDGMSPYEELAVQEISFFGTPVNGS